MNVDDIFRETQDAYLRLVHPVLERYSYRRELAPVIAVAPSVPDDLVKKLITDSDWRPRLLGICVAAAKRSPTFVEPMVQSLRDPRGIAIVPTCALLAVLARRGVYRMPESFAQNVDRLVFDGEVGWAADKAMHYIGLRKDDVQGCGPNYGQRFEDHFAVYHWLVAM